jgi:2-amino-4-hydroxy-6-hydroxymethyldihydropteridine diphosphokinase
MNACAFLGLGSNLGDRAAALAAACSGLARLGFMARLHSSFYWTEPVGGPPQEWYLNAVLGGPTTLTPRELLEAALAIEREAGRVRAERYGPRTLDIDLLLHGDQVLAEPDLTLPHPRLHERRFVLTPLAEIAPAARHPLLGVDMATLLARCPDHARVERLPSAELPRRAALEA